MIYVGCAGWSYPEWRGIFYPKGTSDLLSFYSKTFNAVEVNTTFYSVPPETMVKGWLKRSEDTKPFVFSLKLPGEISHRLLLIDVDSAISATSTFLHNIAMPFAKVSRLAGVLMQLPPFFRRENEENLLSFLSSVDCRGVRCFLEVRNPYFLNNTAFYRRVLEYGWYVVTVDSPDVHFERLYPGGEYGYIRLHGRNTNLWAKPDVRLERYRYNYNSSELKYIAEKVLISKTHFKDIFIFFNNHPVGFAPLNAMKLMEFIGLGTRTRQKTLY